METKKLEIIDVDTACKLLGCERSKIYTYYLKNKLIKPVPRVGRKAYFFLLEVNNILNEKLAELAARKNLKLEETEMDADLMSQDFIDKYVELTIK